VTTAEFENHRAVAITGAGSGLGRDIALGFAAKGYRVFGTARESEAVWELAQASGGAVVLTVCDVADEAAVKSWAKQVVETLGDDGLDVLVNNAGILTPGPLELLSLAAIKREFDVNVFGSLSVIHAFLPALRTARGRIVQIGSMTGRFPLPFNGPSSASKAALEAFADVYRGELKPFGVDFVMVQPGNMATGGPAKTAAQLEKVARSMTPEHRELYGEAFDAFAAALNGMQDRGLPADAAAAKVIEAAEQMPAPIRVPVGPDAEEILRLVGEKSDAELDAVRMELIGLSPS
jgi:NAD(P)-dependent dehydrogenase (short-subunit alcohol dehydrogenase family)